jgi:protein TonB
LSDRTRDRKNLRGIAATKSLTTKARRHIVTNEKILSGHPLLTQAAIDAVRQWKYAPTILDGEPVPVTALVTVSFTLQ